VKPFSAIPIGRRGFVGGVLAAGAATATTGFRSAPVPASSVASVTDTSHELARQVLLSGEHGEDLTLEYLRVLIDDGLPKAASPKRILVVGAGPAGLAAAALLHDAGHVVTVLEANASRTGGRVKTLRGVFSDKTLHAEAGAMRLPDFHPLVLALADKLRVPRRLFYNVDVAPGAEPTGPLPPVTYRSFTGETWSNGPAPAATFIAPAATGRSLIQVNGLSATLAGYASAPGMINGSFGQRSGLTTTALANKAFAPVTVPGTGPIEEQVEAWAKLIAQYDTYSTYQYLVQRAGWDFPTLSAVGTLANMTSRLHYSMFPVLWDRGNINPNVRYWELTNGTASLTEALTARLAPVIRQDRRMIRLTQDASGVRIETTAESGTEDSGNGGPVKPVETFTADYVIVAVPLSALRFCQFEPVLSYRKRRAIDELHYDSATKVLLEFKTRFWEQGPGGFTGGGCVSDSANRFTYFPSHVPGSPGGVVLASYTWSDEAMRWDALTLNERCYFALRNMADMFGPQVYTQFTGVGATQSWARARYALGEAVIFTPGQLHEHHLATATVEGRAHFAGDHTSMKAAWIEGALESAVRSALEVTARA
jgi:monoamine oxidase